MSPRATKSLRFTRTDLSRLVQAANLNSDDFAKALGMGNRFFLGTWINEFVRIESGSVPPKILRYFDLKQTKKGYVWNPR